MVQQTTAAYCGRDETCDLVLAVTGMPSRLFVWQGSWPSDPVDRHSNVSAEVNDHRYLYRHQRHRLRHPFLSAVAPRVWQPPSRGLPSNQASKQASQTSQASTTFRGVQQAGGGELFGKRRCITACRVLVMGCSHLARPPPSFPVGALLAQPHTSWRSEPLRAVGAPRVRVGGHRALRRLHRWADGFLVLVGAGEGLDVLDRDRSFGP